MGPTWGPIWGRQVPGGPHAGPMNFTIWDHKVGLVMNIEGNQLFGWRFLIDRAELFKFDKIHCVFVIHYTSFADQFSYQIMFLYTKYYESVTSYVVSETKVIVKQAERLTA